MTGTLVWSNHGYALWHRGDRFVFTFPTDIRYMDIVQSEDEVVKWAMENRGEKSYWSWNGCPQATIEYLGEERVAVAVLEEL